MIAKSDAASTFLGTRGSRSIEISVPGAFTAVGFFSPKKKPGASAADRGRPSLFKTIDEDRRERHDHISRSGRSTYPGRISVLTSGATPDFACSSPADYAGPPSFSGHFDSDIATGASLPTYRQDRSLRVIRPLDGDVAD